MIVTIDGPAGSGKSTAARKLAARLRIAYLDTGAMYRAMAYAATQTGVNLEDERALLDAIGSVKLDVDCGPTHTRVRVDDHDVTEAIRTLTVSAATPYVARSTAVRSLLVQRQRKIGRSLGSFVSEGRDQGAVVFPGADTKFVLEATLEKRAQRRLLEMAADGEDVEIADVIDNLRTRDGVDAKQWEPLVATGEAAVIDTTQLTIAELIDRMIATINRRKNAGPTCV